MNFFKTIILLTVVSVSLLSAKGCGATAKIDDKEDIFAIMPELKAYSEKFEIKRYDDVIEITTSDNVTFHGAINTLITKMPMNKPVLIELLYPWGEYIEAEGKLQSSFPPRITTLFTEKDLEPYFGRIIIRDGMWQAMEFDALTLFQTDRALTDDLVTVTEYFYVNETVYNINGFSKTEGVMSFFDLRESGGAIKGDGSTSDKIISEFDR